MKIAIICGHSDKRKGASMVRPFQFVQEYEYNTILAAQMLVHCDNKKIEGKVFFRDRRGILGAHEEVREWRPDCVVELHFNSFIASGPRGAEVLHLHHSSAGERLALCLLEWLSPIVGDRNIRGAKPISRNDRGWKNLSGLQFPTVIVEPFFGSNKKDCEMALISMPEIAEAIVDGAAEYLSHESHGVVQ